jgi:hypothetical protein
MDHGDVPRQAIVQPYAPPAATVMSAGEGIGLRKRHARTRASAHGVASRAGIVLSDVSGIISFGPAMRRRRPGSPGTSCAGIAYFGAMPDRLRRAWPLA